MANKPARIQPDQPDLPAVRHDGGGVLGSVIDRAARLQAPAVAKYVASLRADHPDETPEQIIARLEKRYLLTVTGTGGAAGATAAVPGVGTLAAIGTVGAETVVFMEASALYALAVAEVYGISPEDRELRKALVLTAVLGEAGLGALRATVGAKNASLMNLKKNPTQIPGVGNLNKQLMKMFSRRFLAKKSPLILGKLLPAGIGAVVGAGGNRVLGKGVIKNARAAFGPVPATWPTAHLRVVEGSATDGPATGLPGPGAE
ncbi:hypothetical protein [Tsukamurella paurometabola]|uniref:EcsC protein family n=1 Tax=Tsukamurella paurometabola TaxID=2061 RepID=A0A3P8JWE7_TSUPA|nr:hypothetical protein [Tsukamurella paurometabola]MBS4101527.1 hypothetical protein [Tsukamurella paurometabola]UEA84594.1 hypothetical protein LK411_07175 [Tsukamurella paurometabola]VDR37164.1 Uncharacterised protein [Tsukamurella paurometabola]